MAPGAPRHLADRWVALTLTLLTGCVRYGYQSDGWDLGARETGPGDGVLADGVSPEDLRGKDAATGEGAPDGPTVDALVDLPWSPDQPQVEDLPTPDKPQTAPDMPSVPGDWVKVLAGTFTMGSLPTEACRDNDETQHPVTLTHDFQIAATETTQGQFQAQLGYNYSFYASCGASCPVEKVTWYEAAAYCNSLSTAAGLTTCYSCSSSGPSVTCSTKPAYTPTTGTIYDCPGYRLPTEAEWEYAVRANTTTSLYSGPLAQCSKADPNADAIAWYKHNTSTTQQVKQKQANTWGLYDMSGNVREWVHDVYVTDLGSGPATNPTGPPSGTHQVAKGGHYFDLPGNLRSAHREDVFPNLSYDNLGFRCARTL
jgi:formylglycine-generating enzyme required for sulfatase activity